MPQFKLRLLIPVIALLLTSSCAMFPHSNDPNYTVCKNIQSKIQFGSNKTSTLSGTAAGTDNEDRRRLQATYEKMDCQQYQWFKF